jgi:hypothetical protein
VASVDYKQRIFYLSIDYQRRNQMKKMMLLLPGLLAVILVWTSIGYSAKKPKQIGKEEHWVAFDNGTVLDTKTKLMWPSKSSPTMKWGDAKRYAENFKGGGYTDWRLPTAAELETLLDPWLKSPKGYKLTKYIDIQQCCPWASGRKRRDKKDQFREAFDFFRGAAFFATKINDQKNPSLPVRVAK